LSTVAASAASVWRRWTSDPQHLLPGITQPRGSRLANVGDSFWGPPKVGQANLPEHALGGLREDPA
jgi:hypothetical protein